MKLPKLPIGIQTFKKIRDKKDNYLYIDKTDVALNLIENNSYIFLSRPRRFGKSLLMDTIQEIFQGNKALFEGLAIYEQWDWNESYPVIKIDFFGDLRSGESLKRNILSTLKSNQKRLNVDCESVDDFGLSLKVLIENSYEHYNQKVVILIDEYDKAILDNLDQIDVAKENREILKSFYTVIKGCDQYIKFTMLTGVSKFSKASIFSGLNMLKDISLTPKYGNICGYTQANIENEFLPYLEGVDLEKLKAWYNGYNFLNDDVYNPFDILLFIDNEKIYKNYWFSTGTPTFLIKLIEKNNYFLPKLADLIVDEKLLDSFDIENLDFEVVLYQAGYLTIDKMQMTPFETIEYKLKLPNKEVKLSLNDVILEYLTNTKNITVHKSSIYNALLDADFDNLALALKTIFSSIPYNNFTNNNLPHYEGYYASVIYAYFQSLGVDIIGEDVTNFGRIDLTIKLEKLIYIIEFKVGEADALQQVKTKQYHQKYLNDNKALYIVGINFDETKRNISNFEWEKI